MQEPAHRGSAYTLGAPFPVLLVGRLLLTFAVAASALGGATRAAAQVALRADLPATGFAARTQQITILADQPLRDGERLALFVDDVDVTALVRPVPNGWVYSAADVPLGPGAHELVAWIVESDTLWTESLRQPFRVAGALTLEQAALRRGLDVGIKSRLASAFEPAIGGERSTFNDVDGQLSLDGELTHHGGATAGVRLQLAGTSERQRALRAAELKDDAPYIDLASYTSRLGRGPVELTLGNLSVGGARHLISGFASRGAALSLASGRRVQVTAAAMHGSNVVGWDDLTGLGEPDHRIVTANIGVDALRQPGALRLDVTALKGSVLPRSGFDRGSVTDRESSTGVALRVQSQLLDRRVRIDAGLTRSAFENLPDPLLAQDSALVPGVRDTRNAHFAQASVDVLRNVRLGGGRTAGLTMGWAAERVDPLFRTVAGYTRADQLQNRWEVRGDVAGVGIGGNHARSRNNLEDIPSILTSETHRTGMDVSLPVGQLVRGPGWLPHLRWRTDRTHQFGRGVPENSGFAASHVPDQVSTTHSAGLDTRLGPLAFGYRFDRAEQDNRQVGRETADFDSRTHGVSIAASALRTLSLNVDLARVSARSLERDEVDRTRRIGLNIGWRPRPDGALALQLSDSRSENGATETEREDRSWSAQWSAGVPRLQTLGGRWTLRFARTEHVSTGFGPDPVRRENWVLEAGFNLNLR